MERLLAVIASCCFAAVVSADDFYHGLDEGNSDLSSGGMVSAEYAGVQPGVGDSIDIYGSLDDGNADLFRDQPTGVTDSGDDPDIYVNLSGNADLQF